MILDSGERTVHPNGFQRDMHEGKGRMDLLPWRAIIEVSKHCEEGAKKYGERNIDKGCPQHSLIDSAMRHLAKYTIGMTDEDHLRACAWNILWALEQEVCRPDMQDIPARMDAVSATTFDGQEITFPVTGPSDEYLKEWAMENCRIDIHTPTPGGWELNGEKIREEPSKPSYDYLKQCGKPHLHLSPEEVDRAMSMVHEDDEEEASDPSKYDHAVSYGDHSINPERRCVEFTCYYNTGGFCQSVTDLWNPDLAQDCPDFSED